MVARIIVSAIVREGLEGDYHIADIADKFIVHSTGGARDYLGDFRQGAIGPGGEVHAIGGIVKGLARRAGRDCEVGFLNLENRFILDFDNSCHRVIRFSILFHTRGSGSGSPRR